MSNRVVVAAAAAVALAAAPAVASELAGARAPLGNGTVQNYAVIAADGAPVEIGVAFSAGAFDGLPAEKSLTSRCFDKDGSGVLAAGECEGDYETVLPFDFGADAGPNIPFVFAMVNYNPHGHIPEAWSVPHFDIHFYSVPRDKIEAIGTGPCDFFIDCAARERARVAVPSRYVHPDFAEVGATIPRMGNHLIDMKTPELATPGTPFTHTWIFGANEGQIIFHEVMATTAFLAATGDACTDIKQPEARQVAGWYPTRYCFRRDPSTGAILVYMSDFVMRPAG